MNVAERRGAGSGRIGRGETRILFSNAGESIQHCLDENDVRSGTGTIREVDAKGSGVVSGPI